MPSSVDRDPRIEPTDDHDFDDPVVARAFHHRGPGPRPGSVLNRNHWEL